MNTADVDSFLRHGCGRCERFKTPACKVHTWRQALEALRQIVRETELVEEMKWGSPCYTLDGKNVLMLAALNDRCTLSFFKGAALEDAEGVLQKPGPNTKVARVVEFRSAAEVAEQREQVARLIRRAIDVERAGLRVEVDDAPDPMPAEFQQQLATDPELKRAFEALTPGRQRSHILYVAGAKKRSTRENRVERCAPKIHAGKGFNER